MADTQIDIPGVGPVAFPDSMTEAQINAAATRLYQNANIGKKQPPVTAWTGTPPTEGAGPGALDVAGTAKMIPPAGRAAMELATNPNVPKVAAKIGRVVGGVAPAVTGLVEGSPIATMAGLAASGKTAWAGGKTGYYTGKAAQGAAGPVAKALEVLTPYAQALSTLAGAQGVNDLAQMAEPDRQDIGFLGMGPSAKVGAVPNADAIAKAPPEDVVKALVAAGWTEPRAKSYVLQMRKLMANR